MKRTNTATWYESQRRWQIKVQKNGIRKTAELLAELVSASAMQRLTHG